MPWLLVRRPSACSACEGGAGAAQAPLDLDNLHLADLGGAPALEARYELEALLLTGSCLDIGAARGDQARGRADTLRHLLSAARQPWRLQWARD